MKHNRRTIIKGAGLITLSNASTTNYSFANTKDSFDKIPRIELTKLPTACNKMNNMTKALGGPDLYIKRDDVMELAHGGNKTRKLEYSLAEALNTGARAVVTQGGLQSNHVRQTISGAAKLGIEAHVILSNPVPEMKEKLMGSGNYLIDQLMGAHIYIAGSEGRSSTVKKVFTDLSIKGKKPYNIPAGASNAIGSMGYVQAGRELISQWKRMGIAPSHIITATGSCGTAAGLLMGLRYFGNNTTKVLSISVSSPAPRLKKRIRSILNDASNMLGVPESFIKNDDILVNDEYYGKAYGYPTKGGIAALRMTAEMEGIILDPVYTSKAMSGLVDLIKNNKIENAKDVVFLHTGGAPAIHPYADYFKL